MKHFDEKLTDEMREIRNRYIANRESQLYGLMKESSDFAIKYLFLVNAGGGIAVLTYIGTASTIGCVPASIKLALFFFFTGVLLIGIYKAYMVHLYESVFKKYRTIEFKYYSGEIGWSEKIQTDEENSKAAITPYLLGYLSFACFILGSIVGVCGLL